MTNTNITREQVAKSEDQIYGLRKSVRYDIRELTIQIIVSKYQKGLEYQEDDEYQDKSKFYNVLFIPDYQRDFTWDEVRQARFIESILLGLPIPLIFVAENKYSAWEIVDGSQRIRTLDAFLNNRLCLTGLDKIDSLNNFYFKDLSNSRQGKFMDTPLRMIVLSEDADDEVKRDMFERINRGSDLLKPMEKRKGIYLGKFKNFIYDICEKLQPAKREYAEANQLLLELAPIDRWLEKRQELEALLLRYFALSDNQTYAHFPRNTGIEKFLDEFLAQKNEKLEKLSETEVQNFLDKKYLELLRVLKYVKQYSEYGFRRTPNPQTKRILFEAISVGVHVALSKNPQLAGSKQKITRIINSSEFRPYWEMNSRTHSPEKVKGRVEFLAHKLLEK